MKISRLIFSLSALFVGALILISSPNLMISGANETNSLPTNGLQINTQIEKSNAPSIDKRLMPLQKNPASNVLASEKAADATNSDGIAFKIITDQKTGRYATVTSNNIVTLKDKNDDTIWSTNVARLVGADHHVNQVKLFRDDIVIFPAERSASGGFITITVNKETGQVGATIQ